MPARAPYRQNMRSKFIYLVLACGLLAACEPIADQRAGLPLCLVVRQSDDACAYVAASGDTVIPFGRYPMCQTERFDRLALVLKPGVGWVGINRREEVLFNAFIFDNGPDYPQEGLMRIVNTAGLVGYADTATGRVVLPPLRGGLSLRQRPGAGGPPLPPRNRRRALVVELRRMVLHRPPGPAGGDSVRFSASLVNYVSIVPALLLSLGT